MRGKQAPKRELLPDPKYGNVYVSKLINYVMKKGKKSTAQKIVYGAFDFMKQKTQKEPMELFKKAIEKNGSKRKKERLDNEGRHDICPRCHRKSEKEWVPWCAHCFWYERRRRRVGKGVL